MTFGKSANFFGRCGVLYIVMTHRTPLHSDHAPSLWPAAIERALVVSVAAAVVALAMLFLHIDETIVAVSVTVACSIVGWLTSAPNRPTMRHAVASTRHHNH
jgi:hypothetical protein